MPSSDRYARLTRNALDGLAPSQEDALWILDGNGRRAAAAAAGRVRAARAEVRQEGHGARAEQRAERAVSRGLRLLLAEQGLEGGDPQIRHEERRGDPRRGRSAAAKAGATRYCMVFSGRGPTVDRARRIGELIREIKQRHPIEVCLSAGLIGDEHAAILKEAGLDRLNHNLNTSERHYDAITSTHYLRRPRARR